MKPPLPSDRTSGFCLALLLVGALPCTTGAAGDAPASPPTHTLQVTLLPRSHGGPLPLDSLTNLASDGPGLSVTRLDLLLSGLALRRPDGAWLAPPGWFAHLSAGAGRTTFHLANIPDGRYDRVRFNIGVPPLQNHADPAAWPARHPLNSNVNGMHWSWQGGYVFLALEGNWLGPDGQLSGYSYHLATDRQLMTVEVAFTLQLETDYELGLALDVPRIFSGLHQIHPSANGTSTHSRPGDALADALRQNIERAFVVERLAPLPKPSPTGRSEGTNRLEMAATATPYRLHISGLFPQPALPSDNPLTAEGVELGRRLFFDPALSIHRAQSCASCHEPEAAFTDRRSVSLGAQGRPGLRNAMSLINLAWKNAYFWDGRAPTLRAQVLQPIQDPDEMHESLANAVTKLCEAGYAPGFAGAYGSPAITPDRVARALEQFLLTQVSDDSKFDRSLKGTAVLSEEEQRGFALFHTEYDARRGQQGADCFHCHGGPLFRSQGFANNGLDSVPSDGRFAVTQRAGDRGKFAVPSLRNVAVTAPYMHDGRFRTLEEVIENYASGVKRSATLDPNLAKHPEGGLPLSPSDQRALVAFLKTLTDFRFGILDSGLDYGITESPKSNPKSKIDQ